VRAPHTTFGDVTVRSRGVDRHFTTDRPTFVLIEGVDVRTIDVQFGESNAAGPYCGKCFEPIREVEWGDATLWLADDGSTRAPTCSRTVEDDRLGERELLEQMWHEPDRSVASWCHGAAIHVDDKSGTVKLIARMARHRVVVDVRRLPDGEIHVQTVRKRRRHRKQKEAS
jgi:hypothetical protein